MAFEWKDREQLWRGCGIYHITLAVVNRQPLLGELQDDATVRWSELGRRVAENIEEIHRRYPAIDICAKQLMPDHLHLVLWVKDSIDKSIKEVVRGFMQGCNHITGERVFTPPFIRTLAHKRQLRAMIDYVYANPHRALLKRSTPQYFTLRRETIVSIPLSPSLSVHTPADSIRLPPSLFLQYGQPLAIGLADEAVGGDEPLGQQGADIHSHAAGAARRRRRRCHHHRCYQRG